MNIRKLRVETLEERTLLAVVAGGMEMAAELAAMTEAVTWVVNTLDDPTSWDTADDVVSLREAIGSAVDGDTIVFDDSLAGGTITLNGNQLEISKGITIDASDIGGITIDANEQSRVFYVSGGTKDTPVELINLTITEGWIYGDGGGIYNCGTLTLTNSIISKNVTSYDGSNVEIEVNGGGIYNCGMLTIFRSTVSGNVASNGGYNDEIMIYGGGIFNSGTLTVMNSTISTNTTDKDNDSTWTYSHGGGIFSNGTLTMMDTIISGNAANYGGGIYNSETISMTNCTVVANTAYYGGGINDSGGMLTMVNCTVSGNSADSDGGGIYDYYGSLSMVNTIVALNYSIFGKDIDRPCDTFTSHNCIIGIDPGFNTAPVFESGVLVNLDELDLSPTSKSWAIDRGDNNIVTSNTDIVGNNRVFAAWKSDATVDIGAYEYQERIAKDVENPSLIVTTTDDIVDDTDGIISLREAILYAESCNTITFDSTLTGKKITLNGMDLIVDKNIKIDASDIGGITIDANDKSLVFYLLGGTTDEPVKFINLTVTGGNAITGGGIYNYGTLMVTDSTITGNYTMNYGGGIYNYGVLMVIDSTISENNASLGGGIYNYDGTLTVTSSTISGNTAFDGGGINNYGTLTVTDSVIARNSAYLNGGGIYYQLGEITITNCTIAWNSSRRDGGGISGDNYGMLNIYNSIVAQNTATDAGNDVYKFQESRSINAHNTLSSFTDWTKSENCFEYVANLPLFVDPQNSDFTLTNGSQAINVGNNHFVTTEIDLIGNSRIVGSSVDLGAYEFQREIPSTIVTTLVDIVDESDGLISFREAISYAKKGDVVTFDSSLVGGTIILNRSQIEISKGISIDASEIGGITIDANGKNRIFMLNGGTDDTPIELKNLTMTGGKKANYGGAIYISRGVVSITNCSINGNTVSVGKANGGGGAIYNNGTLTVTDSIISDNKVTLSSSTADLSYSGGGGIYNNGSLTLMNSSATGNKLDWKIGSYGQVGGGACYNNSGTTNITNSILVANSSFSDGGGICNKDGSLTIIGSTVSENVATKGMGGGLYISDGTISIIGCIISDNHAQAGGGSLVTGDKSSLEFTKSVISGNISNPGGGGGIQFYCISDNNETISTFTNCVISGNSANTYGYGGGILNAGAMLTFTNCVISGNSAIGNIGFGGGLDNQFGTATLNNCTVSGNSASYYGGGITNWGEIGVTLNNSIVALNYADTDSDIYLPGDISEYNIIGSNPSFNIAPVFDEEGNLTNYDSIDLTLATDSPAINVGNNDYVTLETDLAGNRRISAWIVDLGAYEYQQHNSIVVVTTLDDIIDESDDLISLREAVTLYAIEGDTITFAPELAGETIVLGGSEIEISKRITIDASDIGGITIDADAESGVFTLSAGTEAKPVELFGLTLTGSRITETYYNYALENNGNGRLVNCIIIDNETAGVINNGALELINCEILNNGGMGIYNTGTLSVSDSSFTGNRAWDGYGGGGISNEGGVVSLSTSNITGNYALVLGGGIWNWSGGTMALEDCIISENTAQNMGGGGIFNGWGDSSTMTLVNCIVSDNETPGSWGGGGVYNNVNDNITITNCVISNNITGGNGAGISNYGFMEMTGSSVSENDSLWFAGGGIFNASNSTANIANCAIVGNRVSMTSDYSDICGGGGICSFGVMNCTNSTITGNTSYNGGGIFVSSYFFNPDTYDITLVNTIVAQNYSEDGNDIAVIGEIFGNNNIIGLDPGFVVAPVFDEDGNLTNIDSLDVSLSSSSPAIDRGDNDAVSAETDLAGNPRIIGGFIDIGAYEFNGTITLEKPSISTGTRGNYVSHGANRHLIIWNEIERASGYELAYSDDGGNSWASFETSETSAAVTGLIYGKDITYRVRALGVGVFITSDWSAEKTFNVCPMDINNDGDISGLDRSLMASSWGTETDDEGYRYYADINGDGDISGLDRNILSVNWGLEAGDADLLYPRPLAADMVFDEFASADLGADLYLF